jgi:hypothetical protein
MPNVPKPERGLRISIDAEFHGLEAARYARRVDNEVQLRGFTAYAPGKPATAKSDHKVLGTAESIQAVAEVALSAGFKRLVVSSKYTRNPVVCDCAEEELATAVISRKRDSA